MGIGICLNYVVMGLLQVCGPLQPGGKAGGSGALLGAAAMAEASLCVAGSLARGFGDAQQVALSAPRSVVGVVSLFALHPNAGSSASCVSILLVVQEGWGLCWARWGRLMAITASMLPAVGQLCTQADGRCEHQPHVAVPRRPDSRLHPRDSAPRPSVSHFCLGQQYKLIRMSV